MKNSLTHSLTHSLLIALLSLSFNAGETQAMKRLYVPASATQEAITQSKKAAQQKGANLVYAQKYPKIDTLFRRKTKTGALGVDSGLLVGGAAQVGLVLGGVISGPATLGILPAAAAAGAGLAVAATSAHKAVKTKGIKSQMAKQKLEPLRPFQTAKGPLSDTMARKHGFGNNVPKKELKRLNQAMFDELSQRTHSASLEELMILQRSSRLGKNKDTNALVQRSIRTQLFFKRDHLQDGQSLTSYEVDSLIASLAWSVRKDKMLTPEQKTQYQGIIRELEKP